MALDNGEGPEFLGSDFWLARGKEGALVVFRVLRIEEPTSLRDDMPGKAEPVVCDVLVVDGEHAGTVWRSERIIQKGITGTLRHKTVKGKKVQRPEGSDVAVHMSTYKSFGTEKAGANPCSPTEFEKIKALFGETDGDPYTAYEKRAFAAVGNGESGQPDEDDELPF